MSAEQIKFYESFRPTVASECIDCMNTRRLIRQIAEEGANNFADNPITGQDMEDILESEVTITLVGLNTENPTEFPLDNFDKLMPNALPHFRSAFRNGFMAKLHRKFQENNRTSLTPERE